MAINKKLIHFKKKETFNSELAKNNILDTSICFIKDTQEIWTHGQMYNCAEYDDSEINELISNLSKNVVTSVKLNETDKTPIDGVIDLGNIPTDDYIEDNFVKKSVEDDINSIKASCNGGDCWTNLSLNCIEKPNSNFELVSQHMNEYSKITGSCRGEMNLSVSVMSEENNGHIESTLSLHPEYLKWNNKQLATEEYVDNKCGSNTETLVSTTHSELLNLRNNSQLIPGTFYRITDYECTTIQADTRSANHPFDIIVQALDERTLSENASAIQHEGDTYFANSKLEAWQLKYTIDNDPAQFSWAKEEIEEKPAQWTYDNYVLDERNDNGNSTNYQQLEIGGKTWYLYGPVLSEPKQWSGATSRVCKYIRTISNTNELVFEANEPITTEYYVYWEDIGSIEVYAGNSRVCSLDYEYYDGCFSYWGSSCTVEFTDHTTVYDPLDGDEYECNYRFSVPPENIDELLSLLKEEGIVSNNTTVSDLSFRSYSEPYGEEITTWPSYVYAKTVDGYLVCRFECDGDQYYPEGSWDYVISFTNNCEKHGDVYRFEVESGLDEWWSNEIGGSYAVHEYELYEGPYDGFYFAFQTSLTKFDTHVYNISDGEHIYEFGYMDGPEIFDWNWWYTDSLGYVKYTSFVSPQERGKGVIYRMIDEHDNDCPYDFKNMQFLYDNEWCYTFLFEGEDLSIVGNLINCRGNYIASLEKANNQQSLVQKIIPKVVLHIVNPNYLSHGVRNNKFNMPMEKCYIQSKVIVENISNILHHANRLYATEIIIYASNSVSGNRLDGLFKNLYVGSKTNSAKAFFNNRLYDSHGGAVVTFLGSAYTYNTFNFMYGSGDFSAVGGTMHNVYLEDSLGLSTEGGLNFATNCILMDSKIKLSSTVTLSYDNTTSSAQPLRNLNIDASGWSDTTITIPSTFPVNSAYELKIAKNSKGEIKQWCEADLIA